MAQLIARLFIAALCALSVSCAASTGGGSASQSGAPPLAAAKYFPHTKGDSWAYMVENRLGKKSSNVLTTAQITAAQNDTFEMKSGNETIRYEVRGDGIFKSKSGYYLLKEPLERGSRWPILEGKGEVRVVDTGVTATVPSGTFADCIVVVEEVFQDQRIEWTYAPAIGPVRMRVFLLNGQDATLIMDGQLKAHQLFDPNKKPEES